jgi:hypothetical protein
MTPLAAAGLGVSAALLGLIGGGSTATKIGLAGGAATVLGLGTYCNRPRQLVYLSGAKAIACAVTAQATLLLTDDAKAGFASDTVALSAAVVTLALALRPPIPPRSPGYRTNPSARIRAAAIDEADIRRLAVMARKPYAKLSERLEVYAAKFKESKRDEDE